MGTRSVVAVPQGDGWHGRYSHWDGYPSGVGVALGAIYDRDGLERMIQVLTEENYGWSSIDAEGGELSLGMTDGRFKVVEGYGVGYTTEQGQSDPDEWVTSEGDNWGTEWCYVLTPAGVVVLEATREEGHAVGMFGFNEGAEWTPRGLVRWGKDFAKEMAALG